MPRWTPIPIWQGQDAIIIGGGSSLVGFDFNRLRGRNTIGCNDAFHLGPEIIKVCFFGDAGWFHRNKWNLEKFRGDVVTCSPSLLSLQCTWLKQVVRVRDGLHSGPSLGWNYSTGASAVNLAISLGAIRIFLLGFDMGRQEGKSHWHNYNTRPTQDESYRRFIRGFGNVYRDLSKFPDVRVLNVTDGGSKLPYFHRISFEVFLKYVPLAERKPCINCEQRKIEAEARLAMT